MINFALGILSLPFHRNYNFIVLIWAHILGASMMFLPGLDLIKSDYPNFSHSLRKALENHSQNALAGDSHFQLKSRFWIY